MSLQAQHSLFQIVHQWWAWTDCRWIDQRRFWTSDILFQK